MGKKSVRIRQLPHENKVLAGRKMTLTIRANHLRDMENYCQVMPLLFALLRHTEVVGQHSLLLTTNKTVKFFTAREQTWRLTFCMD